MMTSTLGTFRTVAGSTVHLHHLIGLGLLLGIQHAIKLGMNAEVVHHRIRLQLHLLID